MADFEDVEQGDALRCRGGGLLSCQLMEDDETVAAGSGFQRISLVGKFQSNMVISEEHGLTDGQHFLKPANKDDILECTGSRGTRGELSLSCSTTPGGR